MTHLADIFESQGPNRKFEVQTYHAILILDLLVNELRKKRAA